MSWLGSVVNTLTDPNLYFHIESYIDHGFSYDVANALEAVSDSVVGLIGSGSCLAQRIEETYYKIEDEAVLLYRDMEDVADWLQWRWSS